MAEAVRHARIPLCISDPNLPDNPIVFANAAFCDLTGYAESDVVGQNCRLLQGVGTTEQSVAAVRRAIARQSVETVEILNYRKDGTSFLNALQIGPILDDDGKLMFYFGSQLDVTAKRHAEQQARKLAEKELLHRLRNIVNVLSGIIRMSAREEDDVQVFSTKVTQRLRTLSDAHFRTIDLTGERKLSFRDLALEILCAYAPNGDQQFTLAGPDLDLPAHLVSCIALGLHELATNSVKYGAFSADTGRIDLAWSVEAAGDFRHLVFDWRESGGPAVVKPERESGSRIVNDLFAAVGGSMALDWRETGLNVRAEFPL